MPGTDSSFSVFFELHDGHGGNFLEPNGIDSSKTVSQFRHRKSKRGIAHLFLLQGLRPVTIILRPFHIR